MIKRMYTITLEIFFFFICRIIETRQVRLWIFNIHIHISLIIVNVVFIVTIPNLDDLINDPFIIKSNVVVRLTYKGRQLELNSWFQFLHEILWTRSGDNKVTKFKLTFEWSPWYQISYMWVLTFDSHVDNTCKTAPFH